MQAAVGVAQLEKFPTFAERRRENFAFLTKELAGTEEAFILPKATENSDPCWFGYMIHCKEGTSRNKVVQYLEKNGVQTRMLFAGNLTRHPAYTLDPVVQENSRVVGTLENTDRIMEGSFWVGLYPGMTEAKLAFMAKKMKEAVGII
jgi:CDP-6-deoxy-D-xylo-4-hexulose-3-dehydrase